MENIEESRPRKKQDEGVDSQNRKLKVRNILMISFQHGHQPLESQHPLQQGARRDALPKAVSNRGFLYFTFYFLPWLWYSLAKPSQTLCSKSPFHHKKKKICFREITSWKVKFTYFVLSWISLRGTFEFHDSKLWSQWTVTDPAAFLEILLITWALKNAELNSSGCSFASYDRSHL